MGAAVGAVVGVAVGATVGALVVVVAASQSWIPHGHRKHPFASFSWLGT